MIKSFFIAPPIIIGAIIGANLAVDIPEDAMRISIGCIMIILLITTLINQRIIFDGSKEKRTLVFGSASLLWGFMEGLYRWGSVFSSCPSPCCWPNTP